MRVSSKLWHGSALGGKRKRVLPNDSEWILCNLVLPQRLGTRTRELFKVVVRVSLMAPTTSSQAWEALVRDEGGSAAVEVKIGRVNAVSAQGTADLVTDNKRAQFGRYKGMKWKAYTSLVYASLNRKITASFKGLYPNLLDTNKESKTQGIDKVLLSIACTVCPSPTSGPLGGKLIVGNHPHVSTERLIVVEASVGTTGSIFEVDTVYWLKKGQDTLVFRSGQVQPVNPNIIDMQIDKEDMSQERDHARESFKYQQLQLWRESG
ncbi:hypothetical protein V6N11_037042 [Hibiscus sabdariffa]|uniref:Uncharacterized protein n=1 Tax=Hibiscus sabdariffa TaxID=183260 RepID=A0ABR1ZYG2_9ROSI